MQIDPLPYDNVHTVTVSDAHRGEVAVSSESENTRSEEGDIKPGTGSEVQAIRHRKSHWNGAHYAG